nr:TIGR03767 family metallophosphoesterase [Planctomonas sp. JC2975]
MPRGTTLESASAPLGSGAYRRLGTGAGVPLVVRTELCPAIAGRDDRREGVGVFAQLTDLHIVDAQSPMRFESFVDVDKAAFRPQEALGTHGAAQLIRRIDDLDGGPFTGRPLDCAVTTGDNTDNGESIELQWFLALMNGGELTANTGHARDWEGVQNADDPRFYRPSIDDRDVYKTAGFPVIERMLSAAIQPHTSPGLTMPWYTVFGNHDDSIGGTVPLSWSALESAYTGSVKFTGFADDRGNKAVRDAFSSRTALPPDAASALDRHWTVTADDRRAPFTPTQFMAAHLLADAVGPGPAGHGFTPEALAQHRSWYSFPISDDVLGIALDSTNAAGFTHGSLGEAQFRWLETELVKASDRYVVVFSHHPSGSMDNLRPDPRSPHETRHTGAEVLSLLGRHPNVVAWVNGHTHANRITAHTGSTPRHAFWEITTASHIDFPQQARVIEVCRNGDGTLSIFTTLVESAAPHRAPYDDGSQSALASLYRELAFNDLGSASGGAARRAGSNTDRNTELLLKDPLA